MTLRAQEQRDRGASIRRLYRHLDQSPHLRPVTIPKDHAGPHIDQGPGAQFWSLAGGDRILAARRWSVAPPSWEFMGHALHPPVALLPLPPPRDNNTAGHLGHPARHMLTAGLVPTNDCQLDKLLPLFPFGLLFPLLHNPNRHACIVTSCPPIFPRQPSIPRTLLPIPITHSVLVTPAQSQTLGMQRAI